MNSRKFTVHGSTVEETEVHGSRFNGSAVEETEDGGVAVGAKNLSPDGVAPNAPSPDKTTAPTVNREPLNPEPNDREPLNREPHDREPRLPVIAMTAGAMREDRERCFEAGMDDFVTKPVNPGELARVLGKWLPVAEGRGQKAEVRSQESGVRSLEGEGCGERRGEGAVLPVFDRAAMLDRCMGDEELVQEVLDMFLDNLPQRIQELQAALDAADSQAARMAAHTIKGMAANTSAEALRAIAKEMEEAAESGDLEAVREKMEALVDRFEELRAMLG